jgi:hypothetical protein
MNAAEQRERRMNQTLDEIIRKEADEFWRASKQHRNTKPQPEEKTTERTKAASR